MKKTITFSAFLLLILAFTSSSPAQIPQYYNYSTGGGPNSFPLNIAGGKMCQWLIAPGEFNQPTGAISGNITSLYCRIATGYPLGPFTYTQFNILLGQTTITSFPSGVFYTGTMDTVYKRASVTLQAAADTWLKFILDHSFTYDSTKSLVIQIEQCGAPGASGYSLAHTTLSGMRRNWSVGGCPYVYVSQNGYTLNCGVDITPPIPPTPPYYNTTAGTGTNTYPFGQAGGQRVHWLIRTGTLNLPSPAPPGMINAIYFWMGSAATTTFTQLTVKMGQLAITTLPARWYTSELDTVYYRSSVTLSSINNGWMMIALDNPFAFDTSQALVIDIQQCAATSGSMWVRQSSGTPATRNYGTPGAGCPVNYVGQDGQIINFGVNILNFVGTKNTRNTVPKVYSLEQNYPNPFNPVTTISYSIPKAGNVKIMVFDMLGREVAVPVNGFKTAGSYNVEFDGSELASGVYFYRIEAGNFRDVKKMTLVK
jgi:hypothetical protein